MHNMLEEAIERLTDSALEQIADEIARLHDPLLAERELAAAVKRVLSQRLGDQ